MATAEQQVVFQTARVLFFDPRKGYGRAITGLGRRVYIPAQAMSDAGLVALEPGTTVFVMLDEHRRTHVERIKLPELAPVAPKPTKKKK
jgi:cold shock CspA family protein